MCHVTLMAWSNLSSRFILPVFYRIFYRILALLVLSVPNIALATVQSNVDVDHNFSTVVFNETMTTPVVIAGPPGFSDVDPGVVRLQNITASSFDIRFQEWDYLDNVHAAETIPYLVIEAGTYTLADGTMIEAGVFNQNGAGDTSFVARNFSASFPGVPTLLLSIQTYNGSSAVDVRSRNLSASGFESAMFEQEQSDGTHLAETIGYLAIYQPSGTGTMSINGADTAFTIGNVAVDNNWTLLGDTGLSVQEEQSFDTETAHTVETIAYLTVAGNIFAQDVSTAGSDTVSLRHSPDTDADGLVDAVDADDDNDGLTDVFELANKLDALDATGVNGASGDGDADGFTNLEEQQAGSDASLSLVGYSHNTRSVVLSDVDADGDLDFLSGNYDQLNKLYLNDGTGNFARGTNIGTQLDKTNSLVLADMDADGDLDLIVGNGHRSSTGEDNTQRNRLYLNDGSGRFGTLRNIGAQQDKTRSIAVGDVDGNGSLDVVAGNNQKPVPCSGPGLCIGEPGETNKRYLNDGTGSFTSGTSIGQNKDGTTSIVLGDVDGDGDLDVIAGNTGVENKLFLNNGDNTYSASVNIGSRRGATSSLLLVDVDGDLDLDLLAGNHGQRNRIYRNDGSGNFDAGTDIGTLQDSTTSLVLGDVDADGDLDLLVGNSAQADRLYLNNGSGAFGGAINLPGIVSRTASLALGDVNGDGAPDLIAGNINEPNRLYLNDGAGGFTLTDGFLSNPGLISFRSATHRVEENVGSILLTLSRTGGSVGEVSVLCASNDAAGTATVGVDYTAASQTVTWPDGDSSDKTCSLTLTEDTENEPNETVRIDISNPMGGAKLGTVTTTVVTIQRDTDGDGIIDFNDSCPAGETGWTSSATTDFDGDGCRFLTEDLDDDNDGLNDLYEIENYLNPQNPNGINGPDGDADGDGFTNLEEQQAGTVSGSSLSAYGAKDTTSVVFADVDGDGDIDLLTGNFRQRNNLYLNDGSGAYASGQIIIGNETDRTRSIVMGDVDGDGDLDLLVGNNNQNNKLYLNDGSGVFSASGMNIGSDTDATFDLALGDVDGDGDLDLVEANQYQRNKLYLNDGSGAFSASGILIGSESDNSISLALGDVDGDGDLDLVVGNSLQRNKLYLNNGNGAYSTNGIIISDELDSTSSVVLGDVDGDADLDLLLGNSGQSNKLYLNDGTGVFSADSIGIGNETDSTQSLVLGDVDGDGDLDLLVANAYQSNKLYVNEAGVFSVSGITIDNDSDISFSLALGDVDGDADLDLLVGNNSQRNRLYLNDGSGSFSRDVTDVNSSPGLFNLSAASDSVDEIAGTASVYVSRSGSVGAVSVLCSTSDGTAFAGVDYSAVSITLSWADGDSSDKICSVPVMLDAEIEAVETFQLTISNPAGGAKLGTLISTSVNIQSDTDGDAIYDVDDSCPSGETGWLSTVDTDYDADGCRDAGEDLDDDNDGLSDLFEIAHGLNPLDATGDNGATGDPDGDGVINSMDDFPSDQRHQVDSDADGLADEWEQYHFGNLTSSDGTGDFDGDGYSDLAEFNNNLDPTVSTNPLSEASRRIPPMMASLAMEEQLRAGQTYALDWSVLGYDKSYAITIAIFDCSGIVDGSCGDSYSDTNRIHSIELGAAYLTETGPWRYQQEVSSYFHYRTEFSVPMTRSDGSEWANTGAPIVVRFYYRSGTDADIGYGSLSLLVPGNVTERYYDTTGRRVLKSICPSTGCQ